MARSALPGFDGPQPQYYTIVTQSDDTVLGQVRSFEFEDTIDSTRAGRVGDETKKSLRKSKTPTYTVTVWTDMDLVEVAYFLNRSASPTTGDVVKLDPTSDPIDIYLKQYDGIETSATLKYTTGLYQCVPLTMSAGWDEDGEQVITITGDCKDIYTVFE